MAPQYLFWLDFESSGLLDERPRPTLLEVAWTITDREGVQVVPLRQRFTALPVSGSASRRSGITQALHTPSDNGDGGAWWDYDGTYPSAAVQEMHDINHSGLADEWIRCVNSAPTRMLWDWVELDRLWLDDLSGLGIAPDAKRALMLAGGGVSHYEDRFVRDRAVRTFTPRLWHYGLADVSTVLRVNHLRDGRWPRHADAAIALAHAASAADVLGPPEWASVIIAGGQYDADDALEVMSWADYPSDPHRAGVGIGRALMAYRLLPYIQTWLDGGIEVPETPRDGDAAAADDSAAPDDVTVAADTEAALDAVSR